MSNVRLNGLVRRIGGKILNDPGYSELDKKIFTGCNSVIPQ